MVLTSEPSLEACLASDTAENRNALSSLLEETSNPMHQSGKLKEEGWFSGLLVRSLKNYFLFGEISAETRRALGVPRRTQARLHPRHFGQDVRANMPVIRTTSMRPTIGMKIVLLEESKTISHPLMFKRVHLVRMDDVGGRCEIDRPPFQDPSHTRALP
jgi:hypothetical protein